MNRTVRRWSAAFGLGALALILGMAQDARAVSADDAPEISEIMKKVCSKKGACSKVETAVKDGKWDDAQKEAKTMTDLGSKLGKNSPPKGDKEDWDKLTKKFSTQAKAIADAADKKDSDGATTAIKAFKGSCKACHDAHK
jgi:cytochrome c556